MPPSTETSTPPTTPPTSEAVPVIVILPFTVEPTVGEVMVEVGRTCTSVEAVGSDQIRLQRGRLHAHVSKEIDRCLLHIRVFRSLPRSWLLSRPQDH